jgi:FAD/FMN-containing dehydrogenase
MVIDLQNFQSITATGNPSIYEVGTGLRLGNLANGIWKQGKHALPHGTCTGVGVGGHFTHGGYGHTSRNWGASLDRLVGAEVVLANGTLVKTSAKENSDIFWAMRGAADSIGIATKFVVSTERAPEFLTYFSFKWNDVFNGTKEDFTNKFLHIQDFSRNETVVDEKISFGIVSPQLPHSLP